VLPNTDENQEHFDMKSLLKLRDVRCMFGLDPPISESSTYEKEFGIPDNSL
jgi:hypothetical protein